MTLYLPTMQPTTDSHAVISECGRYRYSLVRQWAHVTNADRLLCWILLNPSTADASTDDPTLRRCRNFARAWGYPGIEIVNLFALRSTDPRALLDAEDPVGPDNDQHIAAAAKRASGGLVLAGWGAWPLAKERVQAVVSMIGFSPHCIGTTAGGAPRHPLYAPKTAEPRPWVMP